MPGMPGGPMPPMGGPMPGQMGGPPMGGPMGGPMGVPMGVPMGGAPPQAGYPGYGGAPGAFGQPAANDPMWGCFTSIAGQVRLFGKIPLSNHPCSVSGSRRCRDRRWLASGRPAGPTLINNLTRSSSTASIIPTCLSPQPTVIKYTHMSLNVYGILFCQ